MVRESIAKYAREIRRALANYKYEKTPEGIFLCESRATIGGHFGVSVNGAPMEWTHNLIVNEGLNYLLDVGLHNQAVLATWYIAPFAGNVTPAASWTAANFTANSTEFTNYDESARVEFNEGTVANQSVTNSANKARFTISTGGGTVYGAGLLSASAKSATSGKLFAATRFSSSRTLLATDLLDLAYTLSLTSS